MFAIPTVTVAKTTLGSGEATDSVTLTVASPASFTARHLLVRFSAIHDSSADQTVLMHFNGDTGNNYSQQQIRGKSTTRTSTPFVSRANIPLVDITNVADRWGSGEILIPDAFSTRTHKACVGALGQSDYFAVDIGGRWANTDAITSVTLTVAANFDEGSTFELCVVDETFVVNEQILDGDGAFASVNEDGGNFPTDDGDLVCISNVRADAGSNNYNIHIQMNGDTTVGNYEFQRFGGNKTTTYASRTDGNFSNGVVTGDGATAGAFGGGIHHIPRYSDTVGYKTNTSITAEITLTGSNDFITQQTSTVWDNTAAVANLQVVHSGGSDWKDGSMLSTYRIPSTGTNFIERIEITGDSEGAKTFSSITQEYDHLELSIYARTGRSNVVDDIDIGFSGDTTLANYNYQRLDGVDGNIGSSSYDAGWWIATFAGNTEAANEFSAGFFTIYNYTKTDRDKSIIGASGTTFRTTVNSFWWEDTSAITAIYLKATSADNFLTGTVFELRGISSDIPALTGASDIAEVNTIALADIQTFNGITVANAEKLNTITF